MKTEKVQVRADQEKGNRFPDPLQAWNPHVDGDNAATRSQIGGDEEFGRGAAGQSDEQLPPTHEGPLPYTERDYTESSGKQ